ncbi:unnamed protein product [Oppiella nova]|uniref:Peptidase C1A papain C-terminal domain-containing protein n=1 Tax=Oppiella nova TaxID=334625 RepID=A0A7R9M392_9ACAR|nr:unnamed protein product [Oppiella nova]CAG2168816.1 unnamed protein product [Oppiella nova]
MGPLVVCVKSSSHVFQTYAGGILDSHDCNTTSALEHSLLLVGEGVANGTDYWLARNSYGKSWGENGYIRLAKDNIQHKLNDGNTIPALGYGTWQLVPDRKTTNGIGSQANAIKAIKEAVMVGYRHIDSAYMYDTEKVIGAAPK